MKTLINFIAAVIFVWVIPLYFIACNTEEQAINRDERKIRKQGQKQPVALAKVCHIEYPCLDSVRIVERLIQGKKVIDTEYIPYPVDCPDTGGKKVVVYVKVPAIKTTIHDTIELSKVVYQTNKSKELMLQSSLTDCYKLYNEAKMLADNRGKWNIFLLCS